MESGWYPKHTKSSGDYIFFIQHVADGNFLWLDHKGLYQKVQGNLETLHIYMTFVVFSVVFSQSFDTEIKKTKKHLGVSY